MYLADHHIHSCCSPDSEAPLSEMLRAAQAAGRASPEGGRGQFTQEGRLDMDAMGITVVAATALAAFLLSALLG